MALNLIENINNIVSYVDNFNQLCYDYIYDYCGHDNYKVALYGTIIVGSLIVFLISAFLTYIDFMANPKYLALIGLKIYPEAKNQKVSYYIRIYYLQFVINKINYY